MATVQQIFNVILFVTLVVGQRVFGEFTNLWLEQKYGKVETKMNLDDAVKYSIISLGLALFEITTAMVWIIYSFNSSQFQFMMIVTLIYLIVETVLFLVTVIYRLGRYSKLAKFISGIGKNEYKLQ